MRAFSIRPSEDAGRANRRLQPSNCLLTPRLIRERWPKPGENIAAQVGFNHIPATLAAIPPARAETYRAVRLGGVGDILSCNRDGAFCEGYDPRIALTRTQTIISGVSHCDVRYRSGPAQRA